MKKTNLWLTLLAGMLLFVVYGCKKDSVSPSNNARAVKFEITGNYSGKLLLGYTAADGSTVTSTVSVPWTKEITYEKTVYGLGLGGNTSLSDIGNAGQTVSIKIYSAGSVVKTASVTAEANGIVNLPTFAYVFP